MIPFLKLYNKQLGKNIKFIKYKQKSVFDELIKDLNDFLNRRKGKDIVDMLSNFSGAVA